MKSRSALVLFACLVVGFSGIASAQDAANPGNRDSGKKVATEQGSEFLAAPVTGSAADRAVLRFSSDASDAQDRACAYMRTYRVKRHRRGSDVVGPAGYTTCVPMQRFEMRSAVQTSGDAATRGEKAGRE